MAHERLRVFDAAAVYGGGVAAPMCMAVRAGETIFLRGQTGLDLAHVFVGAGDAAAQAEQAIRNVEILLAEAGAALADVCKITAWVTDRAWVEPVSSVIARHFGGIGAAVSLAVVAGLARSEMLVAIDVQAVLSADRKSLGEGAGRIVRTADEIFVAAQGGLAADGGSAVAAGRSAADAAAQADLALGNLKTLLAAAGSSLDDICKITVQIDDRAHRLPVYRAIGRHLRGVHPVSTGLIVAGLARPDLLFAIDAAAMPQRTAAHARLRKYHTDNTRYGVERQPIDCEFCQVVRAGKRIFLRGQTGQSLADDLKTLGDAGTQAAQAMRNAETLLGEAGAALDDIVRIVLYATDRAHLAPARDAVLRHLGGVPCAMSEIIVKGLASPDLFMEVDVHAMLP